MKLKERRDSNFQGVPLGRNQNIPKRNWYNFGAGMTELPKEFPTEFTKKFPKEFPTEFPKENGAKLKLEWQIWVFPTEFPKEFPK